MTSPQWYLDYLQTEGWKRRRGIVIRLAQYTCQRCGWNVRQWRERWLEVHHLDYSRLGDELVGDVEVLCCVCHAQEHGKPPRHRTGHLDDRNVEQVGSIVRRVMEALI